MTPFGKSIVLFAGAAVNGGIVAFLIGNSETRNPTPDGRPDRDSETALLRQDQDNKGDSSSVPYPESSLPPSIQSAPQPSRSSHASGVQTMNAAALNHLHYLKTLGSTRPGNSAPEAHAQQRLERALEKLLDHLR